MQSVDNTTAFAIETLLLSFGFIWQIANIFNVFSITRISPSKFNIVLLLSQSLYIFVFVIYQLRAWFILEHGGYPAYFIRGALPLNDPDYITVLNLGKLCNVFFFTSIFIHTLCTQFRFKTLKKLIPYCDYWDLFLNLTTVILFVFGMTINVIQVEIGSILINTAIFLWFGWVVTIEQTLCFLLFSQLKKVNLCILPLLIHEPRINNSLICRHFDNQTIK
jgi:hypothetical protein